MPIGPPSQMPAPKSAWKPRLAPMVLTIVAELDSTGSVSTGVFQMLSAGSTGQPPIICCAEAGADTAASTRARTVARIMKSTSGNRHAGHDATETSHQVRSAAVVGGPRLTD